MLTTQNKQLRQNLKRQREVRENQEDSDDGTILAFIKKTNKSKSWKKRRHTNVKEPNVEFESLLDTPTPTQTPELKCKENIPPQTTYSGNLEDSLNEAGIDIGADIIMDYEEDTLTTLYNIISEIKQNKVKITTEGGMAHYIPANRVLGEKSMAVHSFTAVQQAILWLAMKCLRDVNEKQKQKYGVYINSLAGDLDLLWRATNNVTYAELAEK